VDGNDLTGQNVSLARAHYLHYLPIAILQRRHVHGNYDGEVSRARGCV